MRAITVATANSYKIQKGITSKLYICVDKSLNKFTLSFLPVTENIIYQTFICCYLF